MSYKVGVTLISKETGERHHFNSMFEANCWLNRGQCYIRNIMVCDGKITHADTREEFTVERDEVTGYAKKVTDESKPKIIGKSICNICARAVGFCSWAKDLTPVEGWTAESTYIKQTIFDNRQVHKGYTSFCVKDCPLFVEDAPTLKDRQEQRKLLMKEMEANA